MCDAASAGDARPMAIVIGVLSSTHALRRSLLRRAAQGQASVAQRFLLGCPLSQETAREAQETGDVMALPVKDSCRATSAAIVEKSFQWWTLAPTLFPRAAYIAKSDDDTFIHVSNLVALLRAPVLPMRQSLVYGGWAQFSSFIPELNTHCGWSMGPEAALEHATSASPSPRGRPAWSKCHVPNTSLEGPYVYAAGAFELFSAALARLTFRSESTRALVARNAVKPHMTAEGYADGASEAESSNEPATRVRHPRWSRWDCTREDNFVGLAVLLATRAANASADFWSLAPLVRDVEDSNLRQLEREAAFKSTSFIAIHHVEADEGSLQAAARFERKLNLRRLHMHRRRGAPPPQNLSASQTRLAVMRRIRPILEAVANGTAVHAPPRRIVCHSRAEVLAANELDRIHPCVDTQARAWCRARRPACNASHAVRSTCARTCSVCEVPNPSTISFLEGFEGYRHWRFCAARAN